MRPTAVPVPDDNPDDDQDDGLLDRCLCACGRVASISFEMHDEGPWCAIHCACGAFVPAGDEEDGR